MNASRSPLNAARQDLALRYLPLARSLAMPYKAHWPGLRDDFESAACLALVEAAEAYDPGRNIKFATYARHRIWGALRDVQRAQAALGFRFDPGHPDAPKFERLELHHPRAGMVLGANLDEPVGGPAEAIEEVEAWLRKLPRRHAEVCRQIYVHGKTQHEAARAIGISQSRLSYMHREAMDMLGGRFEANPLQETA